jgi:toxin ParE1/3/4
MVEIRLSAAALADLDEIDEYGATIFGSERASAYSRGFGEVFDRLRRYPRSGPVRQELGQGIRSVLYRQHQVYYVVDDQRVQILRVIHHARDVQDFDFS